jgi:L-ascorbate metabolism protein UlaG (beta-lactamase superfamily)
VIAEIAAPEPHLGILAAALPDVRRVGVRPNVRLDRLGGIDVFPAWHGVVAVDGYSPMIAADGTSPHVGFAFCLDDTRIYVSGDTISNPALLGAVTLVRPHLVCLPVNGRTREREARGILGNMDAGEAVDFAVTVGAEALLPLHHDGVTGNTSDVSEVLRAAAGRLLDVLTPMQAVPFAFSGTRS